MNKTQVYKKSQLNSSFLQIWFPLILSIILVGVFSFFVIVPNYTNTSSFNNLFDISIIWMIIPFIFFGFFSILLIFIMIFALIIGKKSIYGLFAKINTKFFNLQKTINHTITLVLRPFLWIESFSKTLNNMFQTKNR